MKTFNIIPLLFALLQLVVHSLFANDEHYMEAMRKNIQTVYTTQSISELQNSVNALERIALAEKTRWEPYYYAGFGYIMMANREQDSRQKDLYLDQAMVVIEKAKAINAAESEVIALEGFAHMIRVTVDPASRGAQYSGLAMQAFGNAIGLNPENPRALALLAQMQYGTAKFFGSPTTEACGTLDTSLKKFDTFKSENPLSPQWGKEMALELKKECK